MKAGREREREVYVQTPHTTTPFCRSIFFFILFFFIIIIPSFFRPDEETIEITIGIKFSFQIMLRFSPAVQREARDTPYILPSPRLSLLEYLRT